MGTARLEEVEAETAVAGATPVAPEAAEVKVPAALAEAVKEATRTALVTAAKEVAAVSAAAAAADPTKFAAAAAAAADPTPLAAVSCTEVLESGEDYPIALVNKCSEEAGWCDTEFVWRKLDVKL